MTNNNKKQQAAPVVEEQTISQSEAFFLKYKKAIIAAVIALVVIIAGIVLYKTYISGPREAKASTAESLDITPEDLAISDDVTVEWVLVAKPTNQ